MSARKNVQIFRVNKYMYTHYNNLFIRMKSSGVRLGLEHAGPGEKLVFLGLRGNAAAIGLLGHLLERPASPSPGPVALWPPQRRYTPDGQSGRLEARLRLQSRHGPQPGLRDARRPDAPLQVGAALRESTTR